MMMVLYNTRTLWKVLGKLLRSYNARIYHEEGYFTVSQVDELPNTAFWNIYNRNFIGVDPPQMVLPTQGVIAYGLQDTIRKDSRQANRVQ